MTRGCSHRRPLLLPSGKLFVAMAAAFAIESPAAANVTSCADDGGFDTLRHAVLVANDADTIDLSALNCPEILLTSAITTAVPNLTITGPGAARLKIDGNHLDRVFLHTPATGTLTLSNVTIADGKTTADKAYGGCIYSLSNVVLQNAVVTSCSAVGQSFAAGGGVVTRGNFMVYSSVISNNVASAQVGASGVTSAGAGGAFAVMNMGLYGSVISGNTAESATGKVYAGGAAATQMTAKYSTITGNHATSVGTLPNISEGGGLEINESSEIWACTLDHNVADGGGAILVMTSGGDGAAIIQTTISTNTGNLGGGAVVANGNVSFANSTIAFNMSGSTAPEAVGIGVSATAVSTIFADNSPVDIDSGSPITLSGDHNLIKVAGPNITVPPLTITLDPDLGPLAYNGGYTQTHAIGPGSIAIDAGSNSASLTYDERGPPYARVVGSKIDIGAYELDADHIFGNPFEFGPFY